MVSSDPKNAVIRKQVSSVTFGFYTDDDVRARAVVEITSPQAFDALGTPLPRGLYDPHMGPFDSSHKSAATCITCACPYSTCPGHAGVVELCVPVYHPILFPFLVQLLRSKCLACHRFRIATLPMQIVKCKYALLSQGRLQDALELDQRLAQHQQQQRQEDDDTQTKATNPIPKTLRNSAAVEALLLELIQEWNIASASNANGSSSPELTETSYEREFKRQLRKDFLSSCLSAKKCPHCGAFSPKIRQDESNKIFQSKLAATNARINTAEGIVLQPALGNDNTSDSTNDHGGDDDDASSDDEKTNNNSNTPLRDKFMHALEVEAQVRRTWQMDPVLCYYIFGGPTTTTQSDTGDDGEGYRVFFLRAIPVPPSRFRPPMMMGSMTVENSQNMYLNQLLVSNDKIRTLLSSTASKSADDQAAAFTTWIDLQTTINIHFDSSKDPKAGGNNNNGIRQILEKKEGIFRKHMMGKRVDYCCRSVISPDPYIGTDEIGIPLHFAKTLTFPTPVSNWNISELRDLIRRGPEQYPGAVWVQFPDGRRVDLVKMDHVQREAIASRLLTFLKRGGAPPIVGRQLRNGDMVLANRQVRSMTKRRSLCCCSVCFCYVSRLAKDEAFSHAPL